MHLGQHTDLTDEIPISKLSMYETIFNALYSLLCTTMNDR